MPKVAGKMLKLSKTSHPIVPCVPLACCCRFPPSLAFWESLRRFFFCTFMTSLRHFRPFEVLWVSSTGGVTTVTMTPSADVPHLLRPPAGFPPTQKSESNLLLYRVGNFILFSVVHYLFSVMESVVFWLKREPDSILFRWRFETGTSRFAPTI